MGGRRDGHELAEDVLGHVDVVVSDEQGFLDVLVGVALAQEALDFTGELRRGGRGGTWMARPCLPLRVDSPRERFGWSLGNWGTLREV